jgi:hypothetical protein
MLAIKVGSLERISGAQYVNMRAIIIIIIIIVDKLNIGIM